MLATTDKPDRNRLGIFGSRSVVPTVVRTGMRRTTLVEPLGMACGPDHRAGCPTTPATRAAMRVRPGSGLACRSGWRGREVGNGENHKGLTDVQWLHTSSTSMVETELAQTGRFQ